MAFPLTGTSPGDARPGARESVFYLDDAIDREATPREVFEDYLATGDASGLVRRAGVDPPTRVSFRALRPEEQRKIESQTMGGDSLETRWHWACRLACDFPGYTREDGTKGAPREWLHGLAVIDGEWWARNILRLHLDDARARVWGHEFEALFGQWILRARVGEAEKKASLRSLRPKTSDSTPPATATTATSEGMRPSGENAVVPIRATTADLTGPAGPSEAAPSSPLTARLLTSAG